MIFNFAAILLCTLLSDEKEAGVVPENVESNLLLTEETVRTGERGPCPPLMKLVHKSGECICRDLGFGQRPIAYWQKTDRCYFTYTQGPCKSDEWITDDGEQGVACQKHKFPTTPTVNDEDDAIGQKLKPDRQFFVQHSNGTCYETNTRAYCSDEKRLFAAFERGFGPDCYEIDDDGEPYLLFDSVPNAPSQDCDEGYTWDESSDCVKVATFE